MKPRAYLSLRMLYLIGCYGTVGEVGHGRHVTTADVSALTHADAAPPTSPTAKDAPRT